MSSSSLALYIHWPFCKIKCPYCDFNSYKRENINQSHWVEGYLRSIDFWYSKLGKKKIGSVFFGGGTPSLLRPDFVSKLLERIDSAWGIDSGCEITIEANPNSICSSKFKEFRTVGLNRVSVGVQALNNQDLKNLGRDHDREQAFEAIDIVKKWFDNYNLDFIYGRQFQSTSDWEDELSQIISLGSSHLSLYQLTIEENTNFYKLYRKDLLKGIPGQEIASEMFDITYQLCKESSFKQYETSNFAKKGFKCKHNLSYWNYNDYIGIGPGAHGRVTLSGKKHSTEEDRNPDIWLRKKESLKSVSPKISLINKRVFFEEKLIMNLRVSKEIPISIFDFKKINHVARNLMENKLIKITNNNIVLRETGMKMLDYVTRSLLECY